MVSPPGRQVVADGLGAGRAAEAIPLFERALAAFERMQGPDHHNILVSRDNLAGAHRETGRAG